MLQWLKAPAALTGSQRLVPMWNGSQQPEPTVPGDQMPLMPAVSIHTQAHMCINKNKYETDIAQLREHKVRSVGTNCVKAYQMSAYPMITRIWHVLTCTDQGFEQSNFKDCLQVPISVQ